MSIVAANTVEITADTGASRGVSGAVGFGRLLSLLLFLLLIGGWQLAVTNGLIAAFILPAPFEVAFRIVSDLQLPSVWRDISFTLTEILVGFALALSLGVAIGAAIALIPIVDVVLSPYIIALQTIPKIAVAPLLIIWFGFGVESKIVIVALVCVFPILVNAVAGFRAVDQRQLLLMSSLDATPWQAFVKIRLPNAMPYLLAGAQVAMVFAVIGAVVGEFLGSALGLGSQIMQRQAAMDVVGVFSILAILTALGIALNAVTKAISNRVAFWSQQDSNVY